MQLSDQQMQDLIRLLVSTENVELNCEECLHVVGAFAESELAGKTLTEAQKKVEQHLSVCTDCREEYETLLKALREMDADCSL